MKTILTTTPGFQPFTFTVTVETKEEAEMLRTCTLESVLAALTWTQPMSLPMLWVVRSQ
jgi:hypothetical protein